MYRLLAHAVIAAGIWVLPTAKAALLPLSDERTVYLLSCSEKAFDNRCPGSAMTVTPITYKVSVDENAVRYWAMGDPANSDRLPFCVTSDQANWWCQWSVDEVASSKIGMLAGRYTEFATCATFESAERRFEVAAWRWWLLRMQEKSQQFVRAWFDV